MNTSAGGRRKRISDADVRFYEDNIARLLRIMREARGITLDVDDPDLLEAIAGRLASIIEQAGKTRRALIERRDAAQRTGDENDR